MLLVGYSSISGYVSRASAIYTSQKILYNIKKITYGITANNIFSEKYNNIKHDNYAPNNTGINA